MKKQLQKCFKIQVIRLTNDKKVFLDGEDVTDAIRQPIVSQNVSAVSAHKFVRDELKRRQIEYAKTDNVVMMDAILGQTYYQMQIIKSL